MTTPAKPKLRKREIGLALGVGLIAATGAAAILDASRDDDGERHEIVRMEESRDYAVEPFTGLVSAGPQDVTIVAGEGYAIHGEGAADALRDIEVVVEDGVLQIRPRDGKDFEWDGDHDASFTVTVPTLDNLTLAGSGDVRVERIVGERFVATIAGSGEMDIDRIDVDEAMFSIGGSGDISVAGNATKVAINIGGNGTVDAESLESRNAEVRIGGSGDVELVAMETAEIGIFGSGDVTIGGTAKCSVSKIGVGNVRCSAGTSAD